MLFFPLAGTSYKQPQGLSHLKMTLKNKRWIQQFPGSRQFHLNHAIFYQFKCINALSMDRVNLYIGHSILQVFLKFYKNLSCLYFSLAFLFLEFNQFEANVITPQPHDRRNNAKFICLPLFSVLLFQKPYYAHKTGGIFN